MLAKARRDLALASAEAEATGWPARLLLAVGTSPKHFGPPRRVPRLAAPGNRGRAHRVAQRLESYYGLLTTFDDDPEMHASQLTACLDSLEDFPFDLQPFGPGQLHARPRAVGPRHPGV